MEGLWYGRAYAVVALLLWVLFGPDRFSRLHVTILGVVSMYLVGGGLAGAIVGVLSPVAGRSRLGRVVIGIVAALPFCLIGIMVMLPRGDWSRYLVPSVAASALLLGIGGAMAFEGND